MRGTRNMEVSETPHGIQVLLPDETVGIVSCDLSYNIGVSG